MNPALRNVLVRWSGGAFRVRKEEKLARLLLDRPDKNNCVSGQMMIELEERLNELKRIDTGLVLVEGVGRSFCSGADLGLVDELSSPELGSAMFGYMSNQLSTLNQLDAIVVARLHGHCLGGATELASACDLRIAHKDAKIGFLQAFMGITPSWGGANWLATIVGRSTALRLMATAPIICGFCL